MGYNRSLLAFEDIKTAFDRALEAEYGIRIPCTTRAAAVILRSRFNYYRQLDRAQSLKIYQPDHPMWGLSAYDKLVLRIPKKGAKDDAVVFIEKRDPDALVIEEITKGNEFKPTPEKM